MLTMYNRSPEAQFANYDGPSAVLFLRRPFPLHWTPRGILFSSLYKPRVQYLETGALTIYFSSGHGTPFHAINGFMLEYNDALETRVL